MSNNHPGRKENKMHTKGTLKGYNMGATVQLCIGDVVVANIPAVDGVNHIDNAKRLALCWNTHDALVEALEYVSRNGDTKASRKIINEVLAAAKIGE
jgi:hypothetical protein